MIREPELTLEDRVRAGVRGVKDALRVHLEGILQTQAVHPVHPRVEVLWDVPYTITSVTMRLGGILEEVSPEMVAKRVASRQRLIEQETKDPLRYACEPEIWRLIDIEMCKKRLANPGLVLELLVTGGIRAGKTEGATRRINANFFYTPKGWCVGLHETDITSRSIQQTRVHRFLPPEMDTGSGKHKRDKRTKFSYSEGTGFTGSEFNIYWTCFDEANREMECGGRYDFRFYKQDMSTFQGMELTCATSDELVPLTIVKVIRERLSTRAMDTGKPEFLARIRKALEMLERGEPLPTALLGAIYHGVHILTFTPKEGWNATVNSFLNGAVKYGWIQAPLLANVPGVKDRRVPRFAQPMERARLVAYLHTSDNVMRPSYDAVAAQLEGKSEQEIRITAYGDVDKDWQSEFTDYDEAIHVKDWKDMPREGTIYVACDGAGAKPYTFAWYLVDSLNRVWQLQEWPCVHWPIEGIGNPGPWAIPSESDNRNGDVGPAGKLRLKKFNRARWNRIVWQGCERIIRKMAETGEPWKGRFKAGPMSWENRPEWELEGPFTEVEVAWIDSRFSTSKTENSEGSVVTILEDFLAQDNAAPWSGAGGDSLREGNDLISRALADEIEGLPGLIINRECENTRFTLATYTLPEFRETTKAWDEACKEFRDLLVFLLSKDHEDTSGVEMISQGTRQR